MKRTRLAGIAVTLMLAVLVGRADQLAFKFAFGGAC